jgi:hypothetical protein
LFSEKGFEKCFESECVGWCEQINFMIESIDESILNYRLNDMCS